MDVFSALQTAVSGLKAQGYSLDNIAGNIANSQTTGFKRVDTSFVDMIPEQPANRTSAGSVAAFSQLTNTLQGNLSATGVPTNMAINGQGYFAVQGKTGDSGGTAIFGGPELYTRRGDFAIDRSGYLVNGAGYYLKGSTIDPATGLIQSAGGGIIKISNASAPAQVTTEIDYAANLPQVPTTSSGKELMDVVAAAGPVTAADGATFLAQSLPAGSVTVYTKSGVAVDVQMRWAKTAAGDPATWNLFYQNDTSSDPDDADPIWTSVGSDFKFDGTGKLTDPSDGFVKITALKVNDTEVGDVNLKFGTTGLTNYASAGGQVVTTTLQQNGFAAGTLDSLAVTTDGKITGSYSNGRTIPIAQVAIVQFGADNALKRETNGVYSQTLESGSPVSGLNGSSLIGGNVEQSNTDIAAEFSKMIVTQQAYSANTRVMTTAQQMMADVLNVVR